MLATAAIVVIVAWVVFARHIDVPGFVHRLLGGFGQHLDGGAAIVGLLAVLCLGVGATTELDVYRTEVNTRSLVSPADLAVLQRMQQVLPKGAIVMSDGGDDAGMWMAALTTLTPLVPNGFAWGSLDMPLDVALSKACTDPAGAEAALAQSRDRRCLRRRAQHCHAALPVERGLHRAAAGPSYHRVGTLVWRRRHRLRSGQIAGARSSNRSVTSRGSGCRTRGRCLRRGGLPQQRRQSVSWKPQSKSRLSRRAG